MNEFIIEIIISTKYRLDIHPFLWYLKPMKEGFMVCGDIVSNRHRFLCFTLYIPM